MTGRGTALLAAAALVVTVAALLIRPFLTQHHPSAPRPPVPATATVPAARVDQVATHAATQAAWCPTAASTRPEAGCGTLQVTRRQTTCVTTLRCAVELVGVLHTGTGPVPVALTVTLTHDHGGWVAVEVAS